jgi:molecular chaperone GrpE
VSHTLGAGGCLLPDQNPDADAKAAAPAGIASHGTSEAFQQRARLAEDRLAEVLAAYRKLKNENDGYRDRITRNLERRFDQRRERLLLRFIEILDNLDRALEAAELTHAGNPLIDGLILVRTQLLQTLQEEGLERIPVVGLPYDPGVSEAVETRPVTDPEEHHVVLRDLQRGYRLNGRVARASKVVVGDYQAAGAASPLPEREADAAPASEAAEAAPVEQKQAASAPAAPAHAPDDGLYDLVNRADEDEALFGDVLRSLDEKKDDDETP